MQKGASSAATPARSRKPAYGRAVNGAAKKRAFLAHLSATCNVSQSAKAAGAGVGYFYNARRIDIAFRDEWKAAVMAGYDRLEEALLARSLARLGEDGFGGDGLALQFGPSPVVTIELVDGRLRDVPGAAAAPASAPAEGAAPDPVTLVDVQVALAMLKRQEALERRGRERSGRRRPTAEEVEATLNAKLDALARRVTPLGGSEG